MDSSQASTNANSETNSDLITIQVPASGLVLSEPGDTWREIQVRLETFSPVVLDLFRFNWGLDSNATTEKIAKMISTKLITDSSKGATIQIRNSASSGEPNDLPQPFEHSVDLEYWKEQMKACSPDELAALFQQMKLSSDSSVEDALEAVSKIQLDASSSLKNWRDVSTVEEFISATENFLKGILICSPGHCGPLDTESYLILPKLLELTKLGCPTTNSQPAIQGTTNSVTWRQLPFVNFFCPIKIVDQVKEQLSNRYTITSKVYGTKLTCSLHPSHIVKGDRIATSLHLRGDIWVCGSGGSSIDITHYPDDEIQINLDGCQASCQKTILSEYAFMCVFSPVYSNQMFNDIIAAIKALI